MKAANPTYKEAAARRAATVREGALAIALAERFKGAVRRDADRIAAFVMQWLGAQS